MADESSNLSRRELLKTTVRGMSLLGFGATAGYLAGRESKTETRWQIDPNKCIQCGRCIKACPVQALSL